MVGQNEFLFRRHLSSLYNDLSGQLTFGQDTHNVPGLGIDDVDVLHEEKSSVREEKGTEGRRGQVHFGRGRPHIEDASE